MKQKQKNKFDMTRIIYFLIGLILILSAILLVVSNLYLSNEPITEKEVKCYDKYSNEIIGEKCIDIIDPKDSFNGVLFCATFIVIIGTLIIINQIILIREEREDGF